MNYILIFLNFILIYISIIIINTNIIYASNITKYPAILVFGDSTVDTGNNNFILTTFKSNHYPYGREFRNSIPTGRFSNGLLVPDLLASLFGIKDFVPPYLDPSLSNDELRTGVSFASAGSGFDDLTTAISNVISVSAQVTYFKDYKERLVRILGEEEANKIINGAFVLISAGSNDILFTYYDTPVRRSQFSINGYQDFLLEKQQGLVKVINYSNLILLKQGRN